MAWISDLFGALRKFDALLQAERKHGEMISAIAERQLRSEAREEILTAKAEAAAATAGSAVAAQHIGELARRLGSLEERVNQLERGGKPPRQPPVA